MHVNTRYIHLTRGTSWWSLCTLYLHTCQVGVTVGDSGLGCCTCVTCFERWLTPLHVDLWNGIGCVLIVKWNWLRCSVTLVSFSYLCSCTQKLKDESGNESVFIYIIHIIINASWPKAQKMSIFFFICMLHLVVQYQSLALWIGVLRMQPCCFTLHQWRAEKGWIATYLINLTAQPSLV